jgi:SAM-dependent methyltransferase
MYARDRKDRRVSIMQSRPASAPASNLQEAVDRLQIAMPVPNQTMTQDEEWVVVKQGDEWKQIRLHDYNEVFAVQGLYEKWVYEVFQCGSPRKIRELLTQAFKDSSTDPASISVLDLGAGNGYVAQEFRKLNITKFVGIDIVPEAAVAAERDRPGLYTDFVIDDLTDLSPESAATLDSHTYNCLTCVAALGFGDIPPEVFAAAYNRIDNDSPTSTTSSNRHFPLRAGQRNTGRCPVAFWSDGFGGEEILGG